MPRILQHYPNFVSGYESQEVEYSSLQELLAIDFVNKFKLTFNDNVDPDFYRYSRSEKVEHWKGDHYLLMAEYKNGTEWWVVGFIFDDDDIITQLPKNPYKR